MKTLACLLLLTGTLVGPALANEKDLREETLRRFFEGRTVTVLVDMPATSKGIDIELGKVEPIDPSKVGDRINENGVSIRSGARVPITKVNLKDDIIEFHLAGGGFNWFWNSQGSVSPTVYGKSQREKDLEDDIKHETDNDRRRRLERELDDVRRDREEDERRSRRVAEHENEIRRAEDHDRALGEGSRFNLRFADKRAVQEATPRNVMELLSPWIDFEGLPGAPERRHPRDDRDDRDGRYDDRDDHRDHRDSDDVHTGMSWAQVKDILGDPDNKDTDVQHGQRVTIATWRHREMTFENGVLVNIRDRR
jgi:hypothetical protein